MEEMQRITDKYDTTYVRDGLASLEAINKFAATFYKDVAEIYDCLTRIRNSRSRQEVLNAVRKKMELEKLTTQDFAVQKDNGWKIQGKSFYKIFAEVEHEDLYPATYGMMSEFNPWLVERMFRWIGVF